MNRLYFRFGFNFVYIAMYLCVYVCIYELFIYLSIIYLFNYLCIYAFIFLSMVVFPSLVFLYCKRMRPQAKMNEGELPQSFFHP